MRPCGCVSYRPPTIAAGRKRYTVTKEQAHHPSTPVRLAQLRTEGDDSEDPVLEEAAITYHENVAPNYWLLRLLAPGIASRTQPGQFAMLTIAKKHELAPVLPRPMAIYDWEESTGTIDILYGVSGFGTRLLSEWQTGETMTTLGPLGRGFMLEPQTKSLIVIGRGIGTCSLTGLAKLAASSGISVRAVVSARTRASLVGSDFYQEIGVREIIQVTDEGGTSDVAHVRSLLEETLTKESVQQIATCGSNRLLRLAAELGRSRGATVQVSLEAHMACGLGYCHGCSSGHPGLRDETPLVCRDGPVFACILE